MALDSDSPSTLPPISIHTLPESWQDDQGPVTRPFSPRGATGNPNFSLLPPLNTSAPSPALAATPPHIPTPHSRASPALPNHATTVPFRSRPPSAVYPVFPSSLPHANVRDFAYAFTNKLHYGPAKDEPAPPTQSMKTDTKRKDGWRGEPGQGEGSPTNLDLSGTEFKDGPPWKEDEDLLSPVVRSAKHKKSKSGFSDVEGRGRIEERSGSRRSKTGGVTHDSAHAGESSTTYTHNGIRSHQAETSYFPSHDSRDGGDQSDSDDESPAHSPVPFDDEDESRYSRDYQFHIASPDEEMHGKAVALFDFTRENENELPLLEGQVLWVSYRHGQGWLVAQDPKTGENGLVPEEYVRLLRDIEGGLSGLGGHLPGFSPGSEGQELGLSPDLETPVATTSNVDASIPATATTSTHERNPSSVSTAQSYTPIVSHFTTSSKDLEPYAGPRLDKGASPSPRVPQQSPTRSPVRLFRDHRQTAGYGQTSQMQASSSSSSSAQLPARSASQATDLIAFAREQMAEEEEEEGGRNGLGLQMDDGDDDEPVILEDAVAREIRRSQGPPV